MGTALVARLGLGLLLLALLIPSQTGGDNGTTAAPSSNSTVASLSTLNSTTTKGHGNTLQSTTGLFILSVSLLYLC